MEQTEVIKGPFRIKDTKIFIKMMNGNLEFLEECPNMAETRRKTDLYNTIYQCGLEVGYLLGSQPKN
jgi:hypothetical protein